MSNYRNLERDLIELLKYVDLCESNYATNSAKIRQIILSACSIVESLGKSVKESIGSTEKKMSKEGYGDFIKKICIDKNFPLDKLQPLLLGKKFDPWVDPLEWWDIYNDIKHSEEKVSNPEYFKAAICSVLAVFVLTVLLTRGTQIGFFWSRDDFVKISKNGVEKPIQYATNTLLENIIWR